ncbi:MAG TPA: maleylpyruvate isomerase N-terminal domain-containing protein [Gemmatimonadales bacterium]|jgi:uncharacterized protein (TIGR03083 family)|nr:maleylpyruvate isomerase N-terminal domain-containing protein [Gemmatimonadales bacterium]
MMLPVQPVFLVDRFPPLHAELMRLLRELEEGDWRRSTACALWSVKDIVAHLLDTSLRRLSFGRDGVLPAPPRSIDQYADLVSYLNELNAQWVTAARRLSPPVLIELLDDSATRLHAYFSSLDPMADAQFGVAWAGQDSSPVWFDLGREYTERWLHQQQIREAVKAPGLTSREWLHPALDIFMRALPHTYRSVPATPGQNVRLNIEGTAGGVWSLVRGTEDWALFTGSDTTPSTTLHLDQDAAWKLLSKGLSREAARSRIGIEGEKRLGEPIFSALAVMA